MNRLPPEDASRKLQRGVLAALMHITSVREAGAAPLAIEYSDALERFTSEVNAASTPEALKRSFKSGQWLTLFKEMTQHYVAGDRRLGSLELDKLGLVDPDCRKRYGELVVAAARAAMEAQIDKSAWRRRYTARWELSALNDIIKVVQPGIGIKVVQPGNDIKKVVQPDA